MASAPIHNGNTIRELIERSVTESHWVGQGSSVSVFRLDDPNHIGLSDYLVRIPNAVLIQDPGDESGLHVAKHRSEATFQHWLSHTTFLTPSRSLYRLYDIGQPLMHSIGRGYDPTYQLSFVREKQGTTLDNWLHQWEAKHATTVSNPESAAREALMLKLMTPEGRVQLEKLFEQVASLGWQLHHRTGDRRAKWGKTAHTLDAVPKEIDENNLDIQPSNIIIHDAPLTLSFIDLGTELVMPITKPRSDEQRARGAEFAVNHFLNEMIHTFITEGDMLRQDNIRNEPLTFATETEKRFYHFLYDVRDHLPFWPTIEEMLKPATSRNHAIEDRIPQHWRNAQTMAIADTSSIRGIPMTANQEELLNKLREIDAVIGR